MDPLILNESTKQHTFTWKKGAGKIVEEGFEKTKSDKGNSDNTI